MYLLEHFVNSFFNSCRDEKPVYSCGFGLTNPVNKVIIEKSHCEVSLMEQDTIENVS